jgi:hypothetical protein
MSGIMAAIAGNAQNINYVAGLWVSEFGFAQQSPITASTTVPAFSNSTVVRNWIGYFRSNTTGSVQLNVQVSADPGFDGSASTTGRLWLGSAAIAGNDAQASIAINRTFGTGLSSANFNLVSGEYYPLRLRWNGQYISDSDQTSGSILLGVNLSSNVSGLIFYNSFTNGF